MPYERSLTIEQRLDEVLRLIRTGKYASPDLAQELDISIPTISRCVTALRDRGHDIRAEKLSAGWRYVLVNDRPRRSTRSRNPTAAPSAARHPR
jgi:biotin operon repressor